MRVLVTGATGFIGSHVVEELLAAGHEPVALARRTSDVRFLRSLGVPIRYGDITDPGALVPALEGCAAVVHAAAVAEGAGRRRDFEPTNVEGTKNVVEAASRRGVRRVVHISSAAVYARHQRATVLDETEMALSAAPPRWDHYTRTKLAAERLALAAHRPGFTEVTCVRPGFSFGPRDQAVTAWVISALKKRLPLPGGGRSHAPYVYATDVARMSRLCLERDEAQGLAFACVAEEPATYAGLIATFARELRLPPPRSNLPYGLAYALGFAMELAWRGLGRHGTPPLSRFIVEAMRVDVRIVASRGRDLLGWRAEVGLGEAVLRTVAWARQAGLV
jgi:nucleoside-diphosphate-sugar epimerase